MIFLIIATLPLNGGHSPTYEKDIRYLRYLYKLDCRYLMCIEESGILRVQGSWQKRIYTVVQALQVPTVRYLPTESNPLIRKPVGTYYVGTGTCLSTGT